MAKPGSGGPRPGSGQEKPGPNQNLNCYRILGVSPDTSWKEIQRRYRSLVRQYHPDCNPDDAKAAGRLRVVLEAYRSISRVRVRPRPATPKPDSPPGADPQRTPPPPPPPEAPLTASSQAALNSLRRTIVDSPQFPAFAANIQELMAIRENPYNTITEVSQIILRDLSLTTQILKMINTIFFQTYQRQVLTISGAVMVLGLERIRNLAIGLRLFEYFKGTRALSFVMQLIVQSFFTAMQTQELMSEDEKREPEEFFIIALFFNIGELIAAFYFPGKYREILSLSQKGGLSRRAAALQVLKVAMEDLGIAVLQDWNIPQGIVHRLQVVHENGARAAAAEARLAKVIRIAADLSREAMDPEIAPELRQKLQEKACRSLGVRLPVLVRCLEGSRKRLRDMAQILGIDLRKVDLGEETGPGNTGGQPGGDQEKGASGAGAAAGREKTPAAESDAETEDFKRLQFLHQVLEEISRAIVGKAPINQILLMILEGIFGGVGFDRVIFALANVQRTQISARFGLGEGVEELLPLLHAPLASQKQILSRALADNQDYLVDLDARPGDRSLMPEEFWRISGVRSFFISPIVVDQKAIGTLYVDRGRSQAPISDTDRLRMRIFRDQIVIAIRLSRSQL